MLGQVGLARVACGQGHDARSQVQTVGRIYTKDALCLSGSGYTARVWLLSAPDAPTVSCFLLSLEI